MRFGGEPQKPTSIRSRRNLGRTILQQREILIPMQNNLGPIGAVEMGIADTRRGVISRMTGHKVVVNGSGISPKEKGMAKARDEEKGKKRVKAKEKGDEAGHLDLLR